MRRTRALSLTLAVALTTALWQPAFATAATVSVTRPTLSKTTGITTATRLTARGYASPVTTRLRSYSAKLILARRTSSGAYVTVKSIACSLKRSGARVNYTAKFGPLAKGRYKATVRFVWVTNDRKTHVAISAARLFVVSSAIAARTWKVTERDFAFTPSSLTIAVGDKVVFTNADPTAHRVRIDGKTLALQDTGASVTWIAPRTGTFRYSCVIHPSMTGKVTVE